MRHQGVKVKMKNRGMDSGSKTGQMVPNMKENGFIIKWKAKVKLFTQMKISMRELLYRTKLMDKESL